MRAVNMPPKKHTPPTLYGPLGPKGEMLYPPLKSWEQREREKQQALKKEMDKKRLPKGKLT